MDYGKRNLEKNRQKLSDRKSRAKKKLALAAGKTILVGVLMIVAVISVVVGLYVHRLISECPDIKDVNISPTGFATRVLDSKGKEIETLAASGANREYVSIDKIPEDVQHAFVAIEDARFYTHNGIDIRGILRAGIVGIFNGGDFSQGASTITQQLLKNNYFTNWTNESRRDRINRKIQEQYLAVQLEKVTSKEEILENYLNTINLGQNTLGVQAASQRYFNKKVSDLTLSEGTVIAGITQNPSRYNPITNPDENAKRRTKVLQNMRDQGYITKKQYKKAMKDDVYDRIQIVNNEVSSGFTSYFIDALTDQLKKDLMEKKGYTEAQAYQKVYSGGLTIYSTQNTRLQNIVTEEINNSANYATAPKYSFSYRLTITKADGSFENYSEQTMLSYYQAKDPSYTINFDSQEAAAAAIEQYKSEIMEEGDTISDAGESVVYTLQPQTAMTVINQKNGAVVALVGGRGDKTASKTLNRATGITRQPGSTFKIIAAFAPALDAGGMTLATVQDDAPMTYANGTPLSNYDNSYRGFTNIRTAITYSINIVTVKTLTEIGTGLGYEYAQDFGISTLVSGDNTQSLALGGLTNGVINVELTDAYATIANKGVYHKPVFYKKVEDRDGNILLDNTDNEGRRVLKKTTAWLLTDAMKDVMTQGTGTPANFSGMAVAGKSGTTTKDRDTVFAGFTPYYTCAIWGGYDDNTPQSSTSYSKAIWRAVMTRIHENKEYKDFEKPSGIVSAEVCKKSGKLPLENICSNDPRGSMVYSEYFASGTVATANCDHHTTLTICKDSGMPVSEYCPESSRVTGIYMIGGDPSTQDGEYMLGSASAQANAPDGETDAEGDDESAAPQVNAGETCNIHTAPEEVPMEDTSDVVDEEGDIALPDEELEGLEEDFEDEIQ
ncbi:MAG: PBP1A family penicillin-binding protein [Lachnospiraceae bacterium]|nr:PBP1A family penicillin-binding protein [Lachnospiraceae bacterium]